VRARFVSRIFKMKRLIACGLAIVSANLMLAPAVAADTLFSPLTNVQNMSSSADLTGVQRMGSGRLNVSAMQKMFEQSSGRNSRVHQIPLHMLDGSRTTLHLRGQRLEGSGGIQIMSGLVDGQGHNLATLTNNNGVLMGRIWKDGKLFTINGDAGGRYQLFEVKRSGIPRSKKALGPEDAPRQDNARRASGQQGAAPQPGEPADLLVFISERAAEELGGRDEAMQHVNLLVAEANIIFRRSGAVDGQMFRLAKALINPLDEDNDPVASIKDWMTFKPFVADRNEAGADLVAFISYPEDPKYCGTAFRGPDVYDPDGYPELGYSLAMFNCSKSGLDFVRGLGKNLGAGYERIIEGQRGHAYALVNIPKKWQTIAAMGIDCYLETNEFCKQLPYFSNPRLSYNGDPLGVPQDDERSADNAAFIRANHALIAAYRPQAATDGGGGPRRTKVGGIIVDSAGSAAGKTGKERVIKW
jgi:hypothetical protein